MDQSYFKLKSAALFTIKISPAALERIESNIRIDAACHRINFCYHQYNIVIIAREIK